ncbi:FHA domain-containing protein [Agromyces mediolanus]|uniref:FHA domain-containing protein n=1 Tax=Agromyces mediolanus TaxID=41986 RepID=UPI0038387BB4
MDGSDFIVPPPGLVPGEPPAVPERASKPVERTLPSFAPGRSGPPPLVPTPDGPVVQAPPPLDPAYEVTGERVRWRLAAPGGADAVVTGPSVLGRAPRIEDAEGASAAVAIDDPGRTVSKTHALVVPAGDALAVTDLHSTNGVRIERQGAAGEDLAPGSTALVGDGEVLVLGRLRLLVARLPSPNV